MAQSPLCLTTRCRQSHSQACHSLTPPSGLSLDNCKSRWYELGVLELILFEVSTDPWGILPKSPHTCPSMDPEDKLGQHYPAMAPKDRYLPFPTKYSSLDHLISLDSEVDYDRLLKKPVEQAQIAPQRKQPLPPTHQPSYPQCRMCRSTQEHHSIHMIRFTLCSYRLRRDRSMYPTHFPVSVDPWPWLPPGKD